MTIAMGLVLCGALGSAAPALAGTGSIAGTVVDDSVGHAPLASVQVCHYEPKGATEEACTATDAGGNYLLAGLNPGSYIVTFRAPAGQNFVTQYFDGELTFLDADPVAVATGPVTGIDAEMHEGGTVAGTATEAGSGIPIPGLSVCASANGGLYNGCSITGPGGQYEITGLPAHAEYHVEFSAFENLNYLSQSYDEKEGLDNWDPVAVSVGGTTAGIDAVMKPGAQIAGNVTEAGTGAPVRGIEVCALDPAGDLRAQEFEQCAFTDVAGNYTIRSLRSGTFVVVFSRQRGFFDADGYQEQYFDGVAFEPQATRITIAPPATRTGVNASLVNLNPKPRPQPIIVTLIERPAPKPLHCKRGFRKKFVKGKRRCMKVHKKHHRHSHKGPHAEATGR
jgi:carboxypeptidase family protein